jgi:hypothetical protein
MNELNNRTSFNQNDSAAMPGNILVFSVVVRAKAWEDSYVRSID